MKNVVILQGIPGSGKSHYAQRLHDADLDAQVTIVSADHFFVELGKGVYTFDPSKIAEAHAQCFRRFVEALQAGVETVVVDNTNTEESEISPYYLGAQAFGYTVEVVRILCSPRVAENRNTHDVPPEVIHTMHTQMLNFKAPPWWKVTQMVGGSVFDV